MRSSSSVLIRSQGVTSSVPSVIQSSVCSIDSVIQWGISSWPDEHPQQSGLLELSKLSRERREFLVTDVADAGTSVTYRQDRHMTHRPPSLHDIGAYGWPNLSSPRHPSCSGQAEPPTPSFGGAGIGTNARCRLLTPSNHTPSPQWLNLNHKHSLQSITDLPKRFCSHCSSSCHKTEMSRDTYMYAEDLARVTTSKYTRKHIWSIRTVTRQCLSSFGRLVFKSEQDGRSGSHVSVGISRKKKASGPGHTPTQSMVNDLGSLYSYESKMVEA